MEAFIGGDFSVDKFNEVTKIETLLKYWKARDPLLMRLVAQDNTDYKLISSASLFIGDAWSFLYYPLEAHFCRNNPYWKTQYSSSSTTKRNPVEDTSDRVMVMHETPSWMLGLDDNGNRLPDNTKFKNSTTDVHRDRTKKNIPTKEPRERESKRQKK